LDLLKQIGACLSFYLTAPFTVL